jgi:hypothetical protein
MLDRLNTINWEQAYESVRREALSAGPRGHGLALFLSRGMMAWLEALTVLGPRPVPAMSSQHETADPPVVVRSDWTALLADMVLSCLEKEDT